MSKSSSLAGIPVRIQSTAASTGEQTVSLYQKRPAIYARSVSGRFAAWRTAMVWLTQLVFYGLPWLTWNGRQAVLFDLDARVFYVLGLVIWPQDLIYLAALLIICALSLFLFTAVAGRLWCGFACPQTVYTEIFMWIERSIEGDRITRMRLDAGPWNAEKLLRKAGKQFAWIAVAGWTGFTFIGYFTPIRPLGVNLLAFALGPWQTFWFLFYAAATYGNAGFLREQVCKYMCPYARFQGAMFDPHTLIVSYDAARGEPRGSRSRKADPTTVALGSCVDCTLCVQVCPTGIDIRNGLQLECISCAACIDACDDVMKKMNYEPGLIRYSTAQADKNGGKAELLRHALRPRTLIYATLLLAICAAFVAGLVMRAPFKVNVIRDRSVMARVVQGKVENVYRLQVMNATERLLRYRVEVDGPAGMSVSDASIEEVLPAESRSLPLRLELPADAATPGITRIGLRVIDVTSGAAVQESTVFVVPR